MMVIYLTKDLIPTEKEKAHLIKVIYDDRSSEFLSVKDTEKVVGKSQAAG